MLKNTASIQIKKVATFNSDGKKSIQFQTIHSDITVNNHLLQPIIIDYFSTHTYI